MTGSLRDKLVGSLRGVVPMEQEDDGSLTVHHDGTFASLRVVAIAEDLDLVALTQVLAWDLTCSGDIRDQVAAHSQRTLLGTVVLVEKPGSEKPGAAKPGSADVMLRYNFPGAGLTDEALRTLITMVLNTGADLRRALLS